MLAADTPLPSAVTPVDTRVRLIVVEDSPEDFDLLTRRLSSAGMVAECVRVECSEALTAALTGGEWDAVLSDHRLPQFTSVEALRIVRAHDRDLPFLIVSGAIGEEVAVEAMRAGADDFVMKDNLVRLEPALTRALRNAGVRRAQHAAERSLADSEARFRALSANLPGMVFQLEVTRGGPVLTYVSDGSRRLFGIAPQALLRDPARWYRLFAPEDQTALQARFGTTPDDTDVASTPDAGAADPGATHWMEYVAELLPDATHARRWIAFTARRRQVASRHVVWDGIATDITREKEAAEALRISREELRELASYLAQVREQERTAIARELHDDIGSTLTGIKFQLAFLRTRLAADHAAVDNVAHLDALVDGVIQSSSRLMHDLRPGILDEGIVPALEWLTRSFEQRSALVCGFESSDEDIMLPPDRAIAVFRICQEALNNVAKHASANAATVRLSADRSALTLEVSDDGSGIRAGDLDKRGHFGLRGMRERAFALGGAVAITRGPEGGTVITVTLPAGPDEAASPALVRAGSGNAS